MTEGFDLVRRVRQHLRRSAMLLDAGKLLDALAEADAALAIDPQSLPAQAMRDRIRAAQSAAGTTAGVGFDSSSAARPYVPHGVSAASWRGFEQRIAERRFKALLDTVNTSIVAGDGIAARAALAEARELRPDASVLAEFEARVAAVPFVTPAVAKSGPRIWMRAMGAAALFLVGVSLLLGLEWWRPGDRTTRTPAPAVAPGVPAIAPTQDVRPAPNPELGPVPVALNDEESIPAIATPPEPLLQPAPTTGTSPAAAAPPPSIPMATARVAAAPPQSASTPQPERELPSGTVGDASDELVAATPRMASAAVDAGPAVAPSSLPSVDTPVTADARMASEDSVAPAPAASVTAAVSVPAGADQQRRVEEVLRRYARAYGQLDASAARAVYPTIDERALARAFQNLSSQQVSLEDCEIDIRGVLANASCRGQASYAPKVGNRELRTEPRNWRFELRRDGEAWQITDVEARRQPTLNER